MGPHGPTTTLEVIMSHQVTQITTKATGINWMHYAIWTLRGTTAHKEKSWRCHKSDVNQGAHQHIYAAPDYDQWTKHDIDAWKYAGMPGGIQGLRDNFTVGLVVKINGTIYDVV